MLNVPPGLRTRLGQDASEGLVEMFAQYHEFATDRFERRVTDVRAEFHHDLTNGLALIRVEIERTRSDVIRWNLVFWVGQFAAMMTALSFMLDGR